MKNSPSLSSKIKGSLYGFAIGDAMGATTEFMNEYEIKAKYGEVHDIVGGGWLHLKAGEVTDDTQMMLCVCEAIEHSQGERNSFLNRCCDNFVWWLASNPSDVGNTCRKIITTFMNSLGQPWTQWAREADNPHSLGNGSLMRTLPIILAGLSEETAIIQGRLTHNNIPCDNAIELYCKNVEELLYYDTFRNVANELTEPTGHVLHTLNNALYWVQFSDSLKDAIIGAVNHGGDADTIAAITGSLAGALYGYEEIPQRWIDKLSPDVKADLDKYAKLFEKINKKGFTNLK